MRAASLRGDPAFGFIGHYNRVRVVITHPATLPQRMPQR
jgi:hypothetical protein